MYGSSAGAGSGDFHAYRHARDKEKRRIARNKAILKHKVETETFISKVTAAKADCDARTRRNQAKRRRKKERKAQAKRMRRSASEFGAVKPSSKSATSKTKSTGESTAAVQIKSVDGEEVVVAAAAGAEPATNKQVFVNDGSFMENFSKIA